MTMKKFKVFILIVIFLFGYANISCKNSMELKALAINDNMSAADDRLERIKEKGVLTIISANSPPLCYLDPETGKITGIDGDIITEVAKRLGINKVEMKVSTFDKLFTKLLADDEIDCIVSGVYDTPERRKLSNFTIPWYRNYEIFVVPEFSNIRFKEDLKDKVIGIQAGTADEPYAKTLKENGEIKDFILFSDQPTLLNAVDSGRIAVGMSDALTFSDITKKNKNLHLRALGDIPIIGEAAAVIRYSDTNLLNAINKEIIEMKRDKTLNEIVKKYGLKDTDIIPPPPYFS